MKFVFLRYCSDDKVDRSLRRATSNSKQAGLRVGEWLGMELLEGVEACVNVIRVFHAIAPFSKTSAFSLARFCLNGFLRGLRHSSQSPL